MKNLNKIFGILFFTFIAIMLSTPLYSMPNFARKYNMDCSNCHAPIPKLNEFGFKFRAAGFRLPDEIGKDITTNNLGDYFAGRIQSRYDLARSESATGKVTNTNQFTFAEVTIYPASGAFGKYLSSLIEMSFLPDEAAELENAYAKVSFGNEKQFFTARAGIFHPFEGYGASDRPLGLSRPLFQTTAANFNQSAAFKPWGFDQAGIELGYSVNNTFIRATIFNGIVGITGKPAQGGALNKAKTDPSFNDKDLQLTITQILADNGGGITGYFYSGKIDLPTGLGATDPQVFQNSFTRYALYASYPFQNALLLGGYQKGQDDSFNKTLKTKGDTFNSSGFFGELDYKIQEPIWCGIRYAQFTPAENLSDNKINNITGIINYSFNNGLQLIGEYNRKSSEKGLNLTQKDDSFQLRVIYIY